uniref:Uncharacterized protein n=1 Tax=Anguilla anguilla TaxID=7936 RepID=A0A0E9P7C0_ANGAN
MLIWVLLLCHWILKIFMDLVNESIFRTFLRMR